MIKSLLRFFGIIKDEGALDQFEPIYGLPTRSLDEWLSRNPGLQKEHEKELKARLQLSRCARLSDPTGPELGRRAAGDDSRVLSVELDAPLATSVKMFDCERRNLIEHARPRRFQEDGSR